MGPELSPCPADESGMYWAGSAQADPGLGGRLEQLEISWTASSSQSATLKPVCVQTARELDPEVTTATDFVIFSPKHFLFFAGIIPIS